MSEDNAKHQLNPELTDVVNHIASARAPEDAVSRLLAKAGNPDAAPPVPASGPAKEDVMSRPGTDGRILKWIAIAIAAAAMVLLAVVVSPKQSSAFARMQDALDDVQTIQCTSKIYRGNEVWKTMRHSIEEPDRMREEVTTEDILPGVRGFYIQTVDLSTNRSAVWSPSNKKAWAGKIKNAEQVRGVFDLFIGIVRNADADEATEIDRYDRDGVSVIEYEYTAMIGVPDPSEMLINVVVNEDSALPVEIKFYDKDDQLDRTITDLIFDEEFSAGTFSTVPPQGYQVTEQEME